MAIKQSSDLMKEETSQIIKLHQIVEETIQQEKLIVNNLLNPPHETLSIGQKVSDKVARFGGSWRFIILFGILITLWIAYNVAVSKTISFDPYPFILLNLVLSCIAAMQAPIIMMSQNRKEEKDRMRAENDYLVNLKAEMQIRSLHQKIDLLLEDQIKTLFETQAQQIKLLNQIKEKVNHNH